MNIPPDKCDLYKELYKFNYKLLITIFFLKTANVSLIRQLWLVSSCLQTAVGLWRRQSQSQSLSQWTLKVIEVFQSSFYHYSKASEKTFLLTNLPPYI